MTGWGTTIVTRQVTLGGNKSTEIWTGELPPPPADKVFDTSAPTGTLILHATLEVGDQKVRYDDWPQPLKFLDLPDPGVKVEVGEGCVVVSCKKPAKALWLDVMGENDHVVWGDNSVGLWLSVRVELMGRSIYTQGKSTRWRSRGSRGSRSPMRRWGGRRRA